MLKIKKTDLEINIIEKEFGENAYIDPGYHSDPLYKYQSFYIKKGEELERCGITKLSIGPAMMGKFERNHEKIDLRCYSKQSGFFELSEISMDILIYYKGENEDNMLMSSEKRFSGGADIFLDFITPHNQDYVYKKLGSLHLKTS